MFRTNTRCQIITNNLVCGISQQSVGQNRLILCDSSQCWRRIGEAMSSSACCSGEGNERVWLFARDIKRHFISVDKTSATLSFKTDRVQIHDQKSLTKKKDMWLLLAVSATSMMCLRNSCELLGSPCGMWIPIAPAGEAAGGCGPADGRLRPPKRIAECANFHKTTWGWKSKKMVNQPL